ncbi:MAG: YkvA family protein [Intestinibacter sp.]
MNNFSNIVNILLDWIKNVLVRFKKAGFGVFFIKNLFILPDFFTDKELNILSKMKVVFTFLVTMFYFMSSIDLMPEILFGGFGFIDDLLILVWAIGSINEELSNYKMILDSSPKSKIIEDVNWKIKDDM